MEIDDYCLSQCYSRKTRDPPCVLTAALRKGVHRCAECVPRPTQKACHGCLISSFQ